MAVLIPKDLAKQLKSLLSRLESEKSGNSDAASILGDRLHRCMSYAYSRHDSFTPTSISGYTPETITDFEAIVALSANGDDTQ